jgi:hypothetical protein
MIVTVGFNFVSHDQNSIRVGLYQSFSGMGFHIYDLKTGMNGLVDTVVFVKSFSV